MKGELEKCYENNSSECNTSVYVLNTAIQSTEHWTFEHIMRIQKFVTPFRLNGLFPVILMIYFTFELENVVQKWEQKAQLKAW